jgi:DNA-directed RNA polymerase beta subunit
MKNQIIVPQGVDCQGEPEEFTVDLYPLVDSRLLLHINEDGLPIPGTHVKKGMIIVAKTGRGPSFDSKHMPNSLELHGLPREELADRYKNYWTNTSCYATSEMEGTVEKAYFQTVDGKLCAVVEIG